MALLAVKAPVQVESGTGTAIAITALTNANPGVATATGHGLTNGDVVVFAVTNGMVELNEQAVRVVATDTDTLELERLDTTNMSTWVSGDAHEVTGWHTMCNATGIDLPNNEPNKVPTTTLCSDAEETAIGLAGEVSGTIPIQDDPGNAALAYISNLAAGGTAVFRQTWATGEEKVFNAQPVYGDGYSANVNEVVTGQVSLTIKKRIMSYPAP